MCKSVKCSLVNTSLSLAALASGKSAKCTNKACQNSRDLSPSTVEIEYGTSSDISSKFTRDTICMCVRGSMVYCSEVITTW
jgi:hypothetical protein